MSRLSWIIVAALIGLGLYTVYVGRGANKELKPYLGMWRGELQIGKNLMTGYLRIKGSNKETELHLEGPQQMIDVKGTWSLIKPNRISIKTVDVKIDDFGGAGSRDPNKPYVPNEDVTSGYSKPLIFDLSADGEMLKSLPATFGPVTGVHEFKRTFGNVQ